jgi:hypothetical protein
MESRGVHWIHLAQERQMADSCKHGNGPSYKQQDVSSIQNNLHETYQLPRVQLITPDDGQRRCPKHVEFRDKIKFWILDASCWLFIRRLSRCTVT